MATITLQPAYGRDYKSKAQILADLEAGKDFVFNQFGSPDNGRYINLPQLKEMGAREVNVRYQRNTKVTVLKLPK